MMPFSRREFVRKSLLLSGAATLPLPADLTEKPFSKEVDDRLVLLGTQGGPFLRSYAQTPSANLIVYKNVPLVIDAGYGVSLKLIEAGIKLSSLQYIFITHHHSDHNLELGPLLYNAWVAGLKAPIHVYGPIGLLALLHFYWESNRYDIDTRVKDEGRPDIRALVVGHEYAEGAVLSHPDFKVSALRNIHPPVADSFAFEFILGEKRIVFSGDTAYCPALAKFASGADYLVHEVMYVPAIEEMVKRRPNALKLKASILSHHSSTEEVGKIAREAKVKNLVLTHFVPADDKTLTDTVWLEAVGNTFKGNIILGKDLLEIVL